MAGFRRNKGAKAEGLVAIFLTLGICDDRLSSSMRLQGSVLRVVSSLTANRGVGKHAVKG